MMLGVYLRTAGAVVDPARLRTSLEAEVALPGGVEVWTQGGFGLAVADASGGRLSAHDGEGPTAALSGVLYAGDEVGAERSEPAKAIREAHRKFGAGFAEALDGRFAAAVADRTTGTLVVARDPLGLEPLYYLEERDRVVFSSAIAPILRYAERARELDPTALTRMLMYNYNPGVQTLFRGVRKLRPGFQLEVDADASRVHRYWNLSFASPLGGSVEEIAEQTLDAVRRSVRRRMPADGAPAIFVSGGLDSSTVLSLVREAWTGPIDTFSYRCTSESFDESHYARRMAEFVGSNHTEIVYHPEDALLIDELTARMNEPFCDVGINIATYLLGREAARDHGAVFTGDGGDELFGGHPIYEADKIGRYVDRIPAFIRNPILTGFTWLPDSDQKKSLPVKLKRFGESASYPSELLSHRWRLYYRPAELGGVLRGDFAESVDFDGLLGEMLQLNAEADGHDLLSRCLASDYQSICDFYLRRNDLFSPLGLAARYPLFDRDLVEYCARIPSSLKISGWFDTKFVFKKAIEPVVPHDIVYRKDKLGHSIPLKNWLRDHDGVRSFVLDHLSEETVRRRGIVEPAFVSRLVDEHMRRERNNSHRLWTLAVLEMWCRHHVDG